MKRIIYFLMFTVITSYTFAQNYGPYNAPDKREINIGGIPTLISSQLDQFKQNEFLLGWHWGGTFKISYKTFDRRESYIKFSKATKGILTYNKNGRGLTRADREITGTDVFDITKNMLKVNFRL